MNTPEDYLKNGHNITPCGAEDKTGEFNPKRPKLKDWPKQKATLKDFNGKDNIGMIHDQDINIDIDINIIINN